MVMLLLPLCLGMQSPTPADDPVTLTGVAAMAARDHMAAFKRFKVVWVARRDTAPSRVAAQAGNLTVFYKPERFVQIVSGADERIDSQFETRVPKLEPSQASGSGGMAYVQGNGFLCVRFIQRGERQLRHFKVFQMANLLEDGDVKNVRPEVEPWSLGQGSHWRRPGLAVQLELVKQGETRLVAARLEPGPDGGQLLRAEFESPKYGSSVYWLDPRRGHLAVRVEEGFLQANHEGIQRVYRDLVETKEFSGGRHFPMKWTKTVVEEGRPEVRVWSMEVEKLEVDVPIAASELTLELPAGTAIHKGHSHLIRFKTHQDERVTFEEFDYIAEKLAEAETNRGTRVAAWLTGAGSSRRPLWYGLAGAAGGLLAALLAWRWWRSARLKAAGP